MKLSTRGKAAFGLGAFGKDIVYMLVATYLLNYYNVELGMSSVFIGAVLMGARVFDALNDPIMGIVVAKTRTRWGRFRPWIFTGTVVNALVTYALFAMPDLGEGQAKVWLTVFYLLWGVTYTLMDIPFWSMIPAITSPGRDREQLSSLARACAGIGDAVPAVLTTIVVPVLAGGAAIGGLRVGYRWWALIIAVFFVLSEVIFVLNVPERDVQEMKAPKIRDMFASLLHNDQAMTVVLSIIFVYTSLNLVGNLMLYFCQYDIGDAGAYSLFTAVGFGGQVLIMAFVPAMLGKVKKLSLYKYGLGLQILGYGLFLICALTGVHKRFPWQVLLGPALCIYVGYGILNVLLTIFLSDSVDYGEAKNGTREESVIFSMQTFTVKLASGVAVFVAGVIIQAVGLQTDVLVQSESTLSGLRMFMTVPSIVLLVLGLIVFMAFYRLDDARMEEISRKIGR